MFNFENYIFKWPLKWRSLRFPVVVFLILFPTIVFSQVLEKWKAGSCVDLKGEIFILVAFISDGKNNWTPKEKEETLEKLWITLDWLVLQGGKYNVKIKFQTGILGLKSDIIVKNAGNLENGKMNLNIIYDVFEAAGYPDPLRFYDWIINNTTCTQSQILIFSNGSGNSFAKPQNRNTGTYNFFEGAIIFKRYPDETESPLGLIAHEMLHSFGAWDLYQAYNISKEQADKAKKLFPKSIMMEVDYSLSDSKIDELTAWMLGWNKEFKDWYLWFLPNNF